MALRPLRAGTGIFHAFRDTILQSDIFVAPGANTYSFLQGCSGTKIKHIQFLPDTAGRPRIQSDASVRSFPDRPGPTIAMTRRLMREYVKGVLRAECNGLPTSDSDHKSTFSRGDPSFS